MESTGTNRTFETGAVRDGADKKPMLQLISPYANMRLGEWLRFACKDRKPEPYPARNWEKGMPFSETVGSMERHLQKFKMGSTEEDHLAAIMFGAMALAHYEHEIEAGRLDPAIDDMPKYEQQPSRRTSGYIVTPPNMMATHLIEFPPPAIETLTFKGLLRAFPKYSKFYDLPDGTAVPCGFCEHCGATIPHRKGEARCPDCWTGTVYIAGPMRGYPQYNFPAFDEARNQWRDWGYRVISPADLDREAGFDPVADPDAEWDCDKAAVIRRDIEAILNNLRPGNTPDAIALLPGWEHSEGATVEAALGKFLGINFVDAETGNYMEVRITCESL